MDRFAARRRILLLGVSVRALAASAVLSRRATARSPHGLIALDYFGDFDLLSLETDHPIVVRSLRRDFDRPRRLLALVSTALHLDWDGLIYAGGLENRPGLLRRLERKGVILGNGAAVVETLRDPARFFHFLRREGIPHPHTVASPSDRAVAGQPYLWKPIRSGGGSRIDRAALGTARRRGFYRQRLLRGVPGSAVFVADGCRAVVLGVSEQLTGVKELGGGGFRYCGNIAGPADWLLSRRSLAIVTESVGAIARRFELRGLGGLDFVLDDGVPHVLEVNPRYTASMELFEELSGVNLLDVHFDAIDRCRLPAEPLVARRFLAKGIVYAKSSVVWSASGATAVRNLRDRPTDGEMIEEGHPICTLVVPGATSSECRQRLLEEASRLRRELRAAGRAPASRAARVSVPRSMLR